MTEAELNQILQRLERLEAEVRQLAEAVRQFIAVETKSPPQSSIGGEAMAVREPTGTYTASEERIIPTDHPHIVRIPEVAGGTPLVRGPYNTVWGIVELFRQGLTPEQIAKETARESQSAPTLAQVHSALSFYFDHKEEIDKTLAEKLAERERSVQRYLEMTFGPKLQPPEPLPPSEPKPIIYTDHPYIIHIPGKHGGEPIIRDVFKTVSGLVELTRQGMTPQQIVDDYGGELTPAQVYDALSYYYDHSEEIEIHLARHAAADDAMIRISRQQQAEYAKRKREMNAR